MAPRTASRRASRGRRSFREPARAPSRCRERAIRRRARRRRAGTANTSTVTARLAGSATVEVSLEPPRRRQRQRQTPTRFFARASARGTERRPPSTVRTQSRFVIPMKTRTTIRGTCGRVTRTAFRRPCSVARARVRSWNLARFPADGCPSRRGEDRTVGPDGRASGGRRRDARVRGRRGGGGCGDDGRR